jgi:hypothetical protein
MKFIIFLFLLTNIVFAQDPSASLSEFDSRIYSLKSKGVSDFVVDIENSRLTKELNDQKIFGKVDELIFRTYWTSNPERVAIEIIGLPDGFKEVRDSLKQNVFQIFENLIPVSTANKFRGYKFISTKNIREILAQDTTGLAPIPSFLLKFNDDNKLVEVIGNRPIGTMVIRPTYEKTSFSDGKLVLVNQATTTSENGVDITLKRKLSYEKFQGITALSDVEVTSDQTINSKVVKTNEAFHFKNYKINEGYAVRYFLGESKSETSPTSKASP